MAFVIFDPYRHRWIFNKKAFTGNFDEAKRYKTRKKALKRVKKLMKKHLHLDGLTIRPAYA